MPCSHSKPTVLFVTSGMVVHTEIGFNLPHTHKFTVTLVLYIKCSQFAVKLDVNPDR